MGVFGDPLFPILGILTLVGGRGLISPYCSKESPRKLQGGETVWATQNHLQN